MNKIIIFAIVLSLTNILSCKKEAPKNVDQIDEDLKTTSLIEATKNKKLTVAQNIINNSKTEINKSDYNELTALSYAIITKNNKIINLLLKNGADPNMGGNAMTGPNISLAINNNDNNTVKTLLKYKCNLGIEDARGYTPIFVAVDNKNYYIVKLLKKSGAKLDHTALEGVSVLHLAVSNNDARMVSLLVDLGANKKMKDMVGNTPYDLAKYYKYHEIMNFGIASSCDL